MIRSAVTLLTFMAAVSISVAHADTYTWTDEQGTIHFTEDPGTVPEKIRSRVRKVEEAEPAPQEKAVPQAPVAKVPHEATGASRAGVEGEFDPAGSYAGKTYDQWQKELGERESAMAAVRQRLDELAVLLNSFSGPWDEQKKLLLEHKSLSARFKELKAEYFQQVEIARKAGLKINIQQ